MKPSHCITDSDEQYFAPSDALRSIIETSELSLSPESVQKIKDELNITHPVILTQDRGFGPLFTLHDIPHSAWIQLPKSIPNDLGRLARFYSSTNVAAPVTLELNFEDMTGSVTPNPHYNTRDSPIPIWVADKPLHKISNLLDPRSVALVGVSARNLKSAGSVIFHKFLDLFKMPKEDLYVIHPRSEEICGVKCMASLQQVMEARDGKPVDLCVVALPARHACPFLLEVIKLGAAKGVLVIAGGFGEVRAGVEREKVLRSALAAERDFDRRPVVCGPNTIGWTWEGKSDTIFVADSEIKNSYDGTGSPNAVIISQSGGFMVCRRGTLAGRVAPVLSYSVGNQICISVTDMMEWLLTDPSAPQVGAYGIYLEGMNPSEGPRLLSLVSRARAEGRVVVIYKAGRTKYSVTAISAHTGSTAGDYYVFKQLLERAGAVIAEQIPVLQDCLYLGAVAGTRLAMLRPKVRLPATVGIMTNAGGDKCIFSDILFQRRRCVLALPDYQESMPRIQALWDKIGLTKIVDLQPVLDTTPTPTDAQYEDLVRTVLESPEVDIGLFSTLMESGKNHTMVSAVGRLGECADTAPDSLLNRVINVWKDSTKPWVWVVESGSLYDGSAKHFFQAGVPCFRNASDAAVTIEKVTHAIFGDLL
eukprot:gnl/Dysnectes_brevis/304_a338_2765.p1 GENE.gnl/Dysnectes_brevis/304_a338_2765~~gnl/Dysnectes_brevis/304_a338_2765.p1  ORF type:complete len:659 (-),score=238.16 gnl/Dysnectes_brevis/304_a338_2765:46-1983(-)